MNTQKAFLFGLLSLALGIGCSRSKTIATPNGDVRVEENGKSGQSTVTFTGKEGEKLTISSEGGKVPEDYPKDVPVVSGARVVMSTSTSNAGQSGTSLVLESTDSQDKVLAFYKKGLADNGWKLETTISQPDITIIAASKDKRNLSLQIGSSEGKTSVTQVVAAK